MVYQQCGSICPQTCDNINGTCYGGCAEGCFCPDGQVINDEGECEDDSICLLGKFIGLYTIESLVHN